jgi:hypothetical protein
MIRIIFGAEALLSVAFKYPGRASDVVVNPRVFKKSRLV